MEIYVFDTNFNRLGIIDIYRELSFENNYTNHSTFTFKLDGKREYIDLLSSEDGRIVTKSTDVNTGYFVETVEFVDGKETEITVYGRSLSVMTSWRTIVDQQVQSGNVEDVIKAFVNYNMINPRNPNRKIPNLVLGINAGIGGTTEEAFSEIELDVALWEICNKNDISFEILMNHQAKVYVFNTYRGLDRSVLQDVNDRVVFSKAFENVTQQSYVDDRQNYRSTAVVIGNYEDISEPVVYVNDNVTGFNRREIFVDSRDIESIYTNDQDIDISMTEAQYNEVLRQQGSNRLSEYKRVKTLETNVDPGMQFIYGMDYHLGDIVTSRNDDIGIIMHQRVITASETYNRQGYNLKLSFGQAIMTLIDKIKREVK